MSTRKERVIERYEEAGYDLDIIHYNEHLPGDHWSYTLWYWEDLQILSTKDNFKTEDELLRYLEQNYDEIIEDARKQTSYA